MLARRSISQKLCATLAAAFLLVPAGWIHASPMAAGTGARGATDSALLAFTGGGHALGFSTQGMYAAAGSHALHVDFLNANSVAPRATSAGGTAGSRLVPDTAALPAGRDSRAAPLRRVAYANLWDGISLAYTGAAGSIYTTTYSVAPGAKPEDIRLRYHAPLTLTREGALSIAFPAGRLTESAPIAWQDMGGTRVPVEVRFSLSGAQGTDGGQAQTVGFAVGRYDPRHALTIDPTLTWNTFLGGTAEDGGRAIAVDADGNVYVAGNSNAIWGCSPDPCTVRPYSGGRDGFVAKLSSSGTLLWNTFLGGSGLDAANGIALDAEGNIYVVGDSNAPWTCLDGPDCTVSTYVGGTDAYAARLDASGHLVWNAFLYETYERGLKSIGAGTEYGTAIAVDTTRNAVYVAVDSNSHLDSKVDFDVMIFRLGKSGIGNYSFIRLGSVWGMSSGNDYVNAIAVDAGGNVHIAGASETDWDGWGSPVRTHQGGGSDAFAAKLSVSQHVVDLPFNVVWHTFLGGSGADSAYGIAVDGSGNVYVAGESNAAWTCPDLLFCTVRAYTGGTDAFVAKLDAAGHLDWNTFLGSSSEDSARGIAVQGENLYVTGFIRRLLGVITPTTDAFATRLSLAGAVMETSYLGGDGTDSGNGIAVGGGAAYATGSSDATWGGAPLRLFAPGNTDAFAARTGLLVVPPALDVDSNGVVDALTDGLLVLRYLLGMTGTALTDGATGPGAQRTDPALVAGYCSLLRLVLDIDNDTQVDPLTDGLLVIRYLFGMRGPALIQNAVAIGASRTSAADIEAYIFKLTQ